jgi:hypothetical protein
MFLCTYTFRLVMLDKISSDSSSEYENEPNLFSREQCILAMRGESLPRDCIITSDDIKAKLSIIRGIRYHISFANSPEVIQLYKDDKFPSFARARNARLIMSNVIPSIDASEHFPYCIWHPEFATEETYREIAHRYPRLRYNVGRACAAAGYTSLYRELDLLPDISIAEEARENKESGREIFGDIIASPIRYAVMDDYERSSNVDSPRVGAHLNGDTAVWASLNEKRALSNWPGHYFNITEDQSIGETGWNEPFERYHVLQSEHVSLLYSPLPQDLPTLNKDLLILMAAYDGNVDRYARLKRPETMHLEHSCIIRGIYHSTMFAKWWLQELMSTRGKERTGSNIAEIKTAINARFIMDNDLSQIDETSQYCLPYLIWYPSWPQPTTLAELARRKPSMKQQIAHACIVADYQSTYDALDIIPHKVLLEEAKFSPNKYYAEHLQRRAVEMNIDLTKYGGRGQEINRNTVKRDKEPTTTWLNGKISAGDFEISQHEGIFGCRGVQVNANAIKLFVCAPEELRMKAAGWEGGWMGLYDGDVNFGNWEKDKGS